jgi:hypothetical protein
VKRRIVSRKPPIFSRVPRQIGPPRRRFTERGSIFPHLFPRGNPLFFLPFLLLFYYFFSSSAPPPAPPPPSPSLSFLLSLSLFFFSIFFFFFPLLAVDRASAGFPFLCVSEFPVACNRLCGSSFLVPVAFSLVILQS